MELWSDVAKAKQGGPWQARNNKTDLFAYFFTKNKTMFLFDTEELANWLDKNWSQYDMINIRNTNWVTAGIKVPRFAVAHLLIKKETFNESISKV
jgi:hypothetical protein